MKLLCGTTGGADGAAGLNYCLWEISPQRLEQLLNKIKLAKELPRDDDDEFYGLVYFNWSPVWSDSLPGGHKLTVEDMDAVSCSDSWVKVPDEYEFAELTDPTISKLTVAIDGMWFSARSPYVDAEVETPLLSREELQRMTDTSKSIYIVVHGEAYIPEAFDDSAAAQSFADECEEYVSGPWTVVVREED